LKDLHPVRFHVIRKRVDDGSGEGRAKSGGEGQWVPACPISGAELTGSVPAFLVVRRKDKKGKAHDREGCGEADSDGSPNVLSERAVKEMGAEALRAEYGPFDADDMVRLAPPTAGGTFDAIRDRLERKREEELLAKKVKKSERKRKKAEGGGCSGSRTTVAGESHAIVKAKSEKRARPTTTSSSSAPRNGAGGIRGGAAAAARSSVASAVASNPVLAGLFSTGRNVGEKERKDDLFAR